MEPDGATVVVTGGTSGIGRAVAGSFAEVGSNVVVCGRDGTGVEATVEALSERTAATGLRADVRDEFDVERLMETAARFSDDGIDCVVANAGVYHGDPGETPIHEESYTAVDDHMRTNARGVFASIREAVPHLTPAARVLVTTGSVARDTVPGIGSYGVSKAATEAMARAFAADLDHPVGCIDPGQMATDLSGPGGREPSEVADMFRWAAIDADVDALDGAVLGLAEWKSATR
jgi:NAD(P)-dependent dehydrogenase (short-subunit alcohol dehydrogenase family)